MGSDLRKVGGFFKGLWKFTDSAEKAVRAGVEDAERERDEVPAVEAPPRPAPSRRLARGAVVEAPIASACDVCGGTKIVGGARKVPCPACKKSG